MVQVYNLFDSQRRSLLGLFFIPNIMLENGNEKKLLQHLQVVTSPLFLFSPKHLLSQLLLLLPVGLGEGGGRQIVSVKASITRPTPPPPPPPTTAAGTNLNFSPFPEGNIRSEEEKKILCRHRPLTFPRRWTHTQKDKF